MSNDERILVLDPGTTAIGLAVFENGELVDAKTLQGSGSARGPAAFQKIANKVNRWLPTGVPVQRFVYEAPAMAKWGHPNSILIEQGVACTVAALGKLPSREDNIRGIRPGEWTGQRPKTANRYRLWEQLEEKERFVFPKEIRGEIEDDDVGDWEHALDAACIGLYDTKRW